ncbi:hypothetical protein [Chitinophaga sp. Ak27]|uniref:hypothetical protein n=1 Tax=Chitinophaga sp. Ak27 TaxID=2726116 RepID=UPI00145E7D9D|nr:hypothetical protein [Chitinophaga sp. Ak27]NLU96304.1 hypothetical protein [Chitinophaga sp. Ak27]
MTKREIKYLDFFEKFKKHHSSPKIVVTALLLSEIINRFIRDVSYNKFCATNGITPDKTHYKSTYRLTKEYKQAYISLCDDIETFSHLYELVNDDCGTKILGSSILKSPPLKLDFNDLYYCLLAKQNGYIIVTDDSDFFVEDVEIITYNNSLIENANYVIAENARKAAAKKS